MIIESRDFSLPVPIAPIATEQNIFSLRADENGIEN
jgi:hypothetical protein